MALFRSPAPAGVSLAILAALPLQAAISGEPADLIVTHARIVTQDSSHRMATAIAVRGGTLIYVGEDPGAAALAGPKTERVDAGGRMLLPGLIDAHIHPLGIVQFDVCDLKSEALTLAQLSDRVKACVERYKPAAGEWLTVEQWNYAGTSTPEAGLATLRAALDRASTTVPIQLRGNDGHHGGFNSAALARAPLTKATLAGQYAQFKPLIGVDAQGEPNGAVDEEARAILGLPKSARLKNLLSAPERVVQALHHSGITAIQDAAASDDNFALYDLLQQQGKLDLRVNAAQYFAPQDFRTPNGELDVAKAVALARARREHYAHNPSIRAEAVKIFADGVLEGDPNADPPTLPHGAQIRPYLLPRFTRDAGGALQVSGYLDPQGPECREVQASPARFANDAAITAFRKATGYAPAACTPSRGVLTLPRPDLFKWAAGFHQAGFTLHVHAIGDDALRATLEAIEGARKLDGVSTQADTIAHAQLIHPDDVARLGRDHIRVAFTYAWAYTDPAYDISVIPFIDKVTGLGHAALHDPSFYYERNTYPTRSVKAAGGILIAGSDAPVDTRDPRPFVNMQMAVTRRFPGRKALNPSEAISINDVLDAYTINGAQALGRADEIGSIEVGKSADFVIIDQDILALAGNGNADRIGKTRVLSTWFKGRRVFQQDTLSADEQALLSALDAPRALATLQHLTDQVITAASGVGDGSIVSGSPEEAAMAAHLAAEFERMGLTVRTEEYPVRAYRYDPAQLTANGAAVPVISLHATGATWGTLDGVPFAHGNDASGHRLSAALVDAGNGYAADYAKIGPVGGKAVLVRRELIDWPPPQITEAAQRGAAAILFYDHPASGSAVDALRQDSLWGHEALPTAAISIRSAQGLQKRLRSGPVRIELENRVVRGDGRSRNVVAWLKGTERPDEWVVVAGHFDRWFKGSLDDTSGAAAVLELARAFTASKQQPRRSMLFVAMGSEEAGLEDAERDWLAGSYAFVQQHPDVLRNAALVFNLDGFGWTAPKAVLNASPDIQAQQSQVLADLGLETRISVNPTVGSTTDAWNFGVLGGAALASLVSADASFWPLYHTQLDVYEAKRFQNMGEQLRVVALSLKRAADSAPLPIALSAVADFVDAGLAADTAKATDVSFAQAREALAAFRQAAAALEAQRSGDRADAINRLLMNTRHGLVPWLYTDDGNYEQAVRTSVYANRIASLDHAIAAVRQNDRPAALKALRDFYEGRQCQLLSPHVYAYERGFWAGEAGWSSRYQHRAPPPPPAFESACRDLLRADSDTRSMLEGLTAARADAADRLAQSLTLMSAKLRIGTDALLAGGMTGS